MQKLEIFQSLWAMELRHPDKPERSMDENFAMVANAGFDGMCIDPAVDEIDKFLELRPFYNRYDLKCMVNAFPYTVDELQPLLEMANKLDACLVNVIGGVMPLTVPDAVPVIERWLDDATRAGLPLLIETHRDSILNDLYFTLQVMDEVPRMRLCADLSHFVVDREFRTPLSCTDQKYIQRILERSDCFQGRVASREQIQVQIGFPQHQEWVQIFKGWWRDGMKMWRQRNSEDATLVFLCELGPPAYAITDANGHELSDRWEEALIIRSWVEDIWADLDPHRH